MASAVKRRVKVYHLNQAGTWDDRGTGFVTFSEDEGGDAQILRVNAEDNNELVLEHVLDPAIEYQMQGETIITWCEESTGVDLALSFQEVASCREIWARVAEIQARFVVDRRGLQGESDFALSLREPTVDNLEQVVKQLENVEPSQKGDFVEAVLRNDAAFVIQLLDLSKSSSQEDDLDTCHRVFRAIKSLFLLADTTLAERLVSEPFVMDLLCALEFDPNLSQNDARRRHQEFFADAYFKNIVNINDEEVLARIHQNYRLAYVRDVILLRYLDDVTHGSISSVMFYNDVVIVGKLVENDEFIESLFETVKLLAVHKEEYRREPAEGAGSLRIPAAPIFHSKLRSSKSAATLGAKPAANYAQSGSPIIGPQMPLPIDDTHLAAIQTGNSTSSSSSGLGVTELRDPSDLSTQTSSSTTTATGSRKLSKQAYRKHIFLFVQDLCNLAKNIQPPIRETLFNCLQKQNFLESLETALVTSPRNQRWLWICGCDILSNFLSFNPESLRRYVVESTTNRRDEDLAKKHRDASSPPTSSSYSTGSKHKPSATETSRGRTVPPKPQSLIGVLVDTMIAEITEEGVRLQLQELLIRMLDPETMPDDPHSFVEHFYAAHAYRLVHVLAEAPLASPRQNAHGDANAAFSRTPIHPRASQFTTGSFHALELLSFCVRAHGSNASAFLAESSVLECVADLLSSELRVGIDGAADIAPAARSIVETRDFLVPAAQAEASETAEMGSSETRGVPRSITDDAEPKPMLSLTGAEAAALPSDLALVCGAIRFVRSCLTLADSAYEQAILKSRVLDTIVALFFLNGARYNLLNSVVIDLVEMIRKKNIRRVVGYIIEHHGSKLKNIQYVNTFSRLQLRYEQNLEPRPNAAGMRGGRSRFDGSRQKSRSRVSLTARHGRVREATAARTFSRLGGSSEKLRLNPLRRGDPFVDEAGNMEAGSSLAFGSKNDGLDRVLEGDAYVEATESEHGGSDDFEEDPNSQEEDGPQTAIDESLNGDSESSSWSQTQPARRGNEKLKRALAWREQSDEEAYFDETGDGEEPTEPANDTSEKSSSPGSDGLRADESATSESVNAFAVLDGELNNRAEMKTRVSIYQDLDTEVYPALVGEHSIASLPERRADSERRSALQAFASRSEDLSPAKRPRIDVGERSPMCMQFADSTRNVGSKDAVPGSKAKTPAISSHQKTRAFELDQDETRDESSLAADVSLTRKSNSSEVLPSKVVTSASSGNSSSLAEATEHKKPTEHVKLSVMPKAYADESEDDMAALIARRALPKRNTTTRAPDEKENELSIRGDVEAGRNDDKLAQISSKSSMSSEALNFMFTGLKQGFDKIISRATGKNTSEEREDLSASAASSTSNTENVPGGLKQGIDSSVRSGGGFARLEASYSQKEEDTLDE